MSLAFGYPGMDLLFFHGESFEPTYVVDEGMSREAMNRVNEEGTLTQRDKAELHTDVYVSEM